MDVCPCDICQSYDFTSDNFVNIHNDCSQQTQIEMFEQSLNLAGFSLWNSSDIVFFGW